MSDTMKEALKGWISNALWIVGTQGAKQYTGKHTIKSRCPFMSNIMNFWKNLRIKTKITIAYLAILMLSFIVTFWAMSELNDAYTKRRIASGGMQTVSALKGNLSLILNGVSQSSNVVYFDSQVQDSLRSVREGEVDSTLYTTITNSLINLILSGDYISGVYIWDAYGNFYSSYTNAPKSANPNMIPYTNWYKNLESFNGNGHFIRGSEGVIEYYGNKEYITYIREICDENTYNRLAVLMVTVNEEAIHSYFEELEDEYNSNFCIVNSDNEFIVAPTAYKYGIANLLEKENVIVEDGYTEQKLNGKEVFCVTQDMGIEDWKLVGVFPISTDYSVESYYSTIVLLIIFINVIFVFIASFMLTKMIFNPLAKVENHMLLVEQGQFKEMEIDKGQNEITNLTRVYNHMVGSMKELISTVKEEEKIIAKGELDLIQAQINPHFLYNTLDAVSALALMQDFDKCFKMTQALGSFYRNSLNSGRNFISIEDEIQCIKSYITILNIRYENELQVEIEVEEELLQCQVLKLLLQPLVENAAHHGIKPKCDNGTIGIKVFSNDDDEIVFIVSDDGVGMSEERIQEIMEGKTITGKSGFGIHSLIQRIRLYYGIDSPVIIHSEIGTGTEVVVRIKKITQGEAKDEVKN